LAPHLRKVTRRFLAMIGEVQPDRYPRARDLPHTWRPEDYDKRFSPSRGVDSSSRICLPSPLPTLAHAD
jgi:hypothetical protein